MNTTTTTTEKATVAAAVIDTTAPATATAPATTGKATTATTGKADKATGKAATGKDGKATGKADKATAATATGKADKATAATVREKLTCNLRLQDCKDGTRRGRFDRITVKDFSDKSIFEEYKKAYCYAAIMFARCMSEPDTAKSNALRNHAMRHINDAYTIAATAAGLTDDEKATFKVCKTHVRAWIASGAFARLRINYATGEKSIDGKAWSAIQKIAELDMSDILNGRKRLTTVNANEKAAAVVSADQTTAPAPKK